MDISAYLASVQDNPQSAALAKNIMQPGIPSPDGSSAPDAGGAPQPESWADQAQQDIGPVTGGFDQAQMGMNDTPMAPDGSDNLDQGMQSFNDQPPEDQGYAMGGMVRPPRVPKVRAPKARQPKAGGGGGKGGPGLFSPSTRRGGPGEDPSTFQPEGSISDIGMYDASGNLKGITDIGITKNEIYGNPNFAHNDVSNGEARGDNQYGVGGPAGDSSGGLAEGGSVDELPDDKGDDQYARLPSSENVDDRRRDVITPQQYAGMSAHEQAMASNYPGGPGDDMLAGSKRTLKGPMKFDEGGEVDETLSPENTSPGIPPPVEETERGEEMSGEMDQEKPMGFRDRMGAAIGMQGRGMQEAVANGMKEIYRQNGVNTGVPDPSTEQRVRAMMQGKGATPPDQAEAAIEANGGNAGGAVEAVYNFFNKKSSPGAGMQALGGLGLSETGASEGTGITDAIGQGAAAAAGMIQHIRTVWNKASAIASAAADGGNLPKAAEALETGLNKIPDGTQVKVTPTQGGVDVNVDGKNTPLTPEQMHHIAATPFDVIAHMGVPQTIANLQNVSELQHMSGQQPQQSQVPASVNMQQATAVKARMAQQDQQQGLDPSGAPRQAPALTPRPGMQSVTISGEANRPATPGPQGQSDEPSLDTPDRINIFRGGYGLQQVDREGKVVYDRGDRTNPTLSHERIANTAGNARVQQEQIRQQGLNKRAEDSSSSPHGREATLKGLREKQAMTAAQAEIKRAENDNPGKPIDTAAIYKKYGLEHLAAGGSQAKPQTQGPKVGQVVNGKTFLGGNPNDRNSWR